MKKLFKILYGVFFAAIIVIAVGVIFPLLPIPGNYQLLTVLSGSMEPKIHTGSVVVVKPADHYKVGDIITFSDDKISITHRIHEIKQKDGHNIYITKGDANNGADNNEVLKENISGKILFSVPFVGYAISFAKKPLGFVLVIVVPAVIIVGDEIKKIWKEIKKIRGKKKEGEGDGEKKGEEKERNKEKK